MTNRTLFLLALSLAGLTASAQRTETLLERGWRYLRTDVKTYYAPDFDDSKWQTASVPHDWAIKGRFSVDNDDPTGCKTGGLPYSGAG